MTRLSGEISLWLQITLFSVDQSNFWKICASDYITEDSFTLIFVPHMTTCEIFVKQLLPLGFLQNRNSSLHAYSQKHIHACRIEWQTTHIHTNNSPESLFDKQNRPCFPPDCLVPSLQTHDIVWRWWMTLSLLLIKRLICSNSYVNHWVYLTLASLC